MKVSFHTLGCKQNYAETSHIREQFEQNGFTVVPFGEECNAVIINTCTVTENADTECRKIIRRALKVSPNAFVGVTGCYAQLQPEEIASVDGVDAVFGAKEKFEIPNLIHKFEKFDSPKIFVEEAEDLEFVTASFSENDSRSRAFLKIQDGCDYNCSFCTIPLARGAARSMNFNEIVPNIDRLVSAGFHEIILTGINLGEFLSPTGEKFVDVLKEIDEHSPSARIRLGSVEPNKVTQEIVDVVTQSLSFCNHFHIPLQSGSPEILKKMRRRYKQEYYADLVHRIKYADSNACIGVDVITGFPGETDEHFEETKALLQELPISYLHVFTYSERDNTPARDYEGRVPLHVRKARTTQLREISERKKKEYYESQIGATVTVVPENYSHETGMWVGYSENYVRVAFKAPMSLVQQPTKVRLIEIANETMVGEALEIAVPTETPSYFSLLVR